MLATWQLEGAVAFLSPAAEFISPTMDRVHEGDARDSDRHGDRGRDAELSEFAAVYARHYRDVYRYCLIFLRASDEAEDAVADAFERAWRAWMSANGPRGEALPWLLVIARRLIVDRARRKRRIPWLPLDLVPAALEPGTPAQSDRTDFWLWFESLSSSLSARQREALLLRYVFDLPDRQIAAVMGLSDAGVRSLIHRAIETLRAHPELVR